MGHVTGSELSARELGPGLSSIYPGLRRLSSPPRSPDHPFQICRIEFAFATRFARTLLRLHRLFPRSCPRVQGSTFFLRPCVSFGNPSSVSLSSFPVLLFLSAFVFHTFSSPPLSYSYIIRRSDCSVEFLVCRITCATRFFLPFFVNPGFRPPFS